jgi:hypothetical protein
MSEEHDGSVGLLGTKSTPPWGSSSQIHIPFRWRQLATITISIKISMPFQGIIISNKVR